MASAASHASPTPSADFALFLQLTLAANPPAAAYYTTSGEDPAVNPEGEQDTVEILQPETREQLPQEPPARPETSKAPGIILTPGGDSTPDGWAPFKSTITLLTLDKSPATYGEEIAVTVTLTPPSATGEVQLLVDGSPLGRSVAVVDGVATLRDVVDLLPGSHVISAEYGGDDSHGMSAAPLQKLYVKKASQKIEFPLLPSVSPGSPSFALAATASSGLPVSYLGGSPAVATLSEGVVTIVGTGSTVVTASQEGNDYFFPAASVSRTLDVK